MDASRACEIVPTEWKIYLHLPRNTIKTCIYIYHLNVIRTHKRKKIISIDRLNEIITIFFHPTNQIRTFKSRYTILINNLTGIEYHLSIDVIIKLPNHFSQMYSRYDLLSDKMIQR